MAAAIACKLKCALQCGKAVIHGCSLARSMRDASVSEAVHRNVLLSHPRRSPATVMFPRAGECSAGRVVDQLVKRTQDMALARGGAHVSFRLVVVAGFEGG